MTDREIVELIRVKYPKHSKAAYSLAKHTEVTGVMLCPGAQYIDDVAHERKRYPENRANTFRVCGRLPEDLGKRVAAKLRERGGSMQDLLLELLTAWVKED